MKIDQVRKLIENYSGKQLHFIIAELYKAMPKSAREKAAIDQLIEAPDDRKSTAQAPKVKAPNLDEVAFEIECFIEDAKEGVYFRQRNKRSNWRFQARNFYKALTARENQDYDPACTAQLLEGLYRVFCEGCNVYLFSGSDPFASVGVPQPEFFDSLLASKAIEMGPRELVGFGIDLILVRGHDQNTRDKDLVEVFQRHLKTPDMREMTIEECKKRVGMSSSANPLAGRRSNDEIINTLCEVHFSTCAVLGEFDRAIEFYKQHAHNRPDREIQLYVLLDLLKRFGQKQLWVREFEFAETVGITPREELRKLHRYVKNHDEFPKDRSFLGRRNPAQIRAYARPGIWSSSSRWVCASRCA